MITIHALAGCTSRALAAMPAPTAPRAHAEASAVGHFREARTYPPPPPLPWVDGEWAPRKYDDTHDAPRARIGKPVVPDARPRPRHATTTTMRMRTATTGVARLKMSGAGGLTARARAAAARSRSSEASSSARRTARRECAEAAELETRRAAECPYALGSRACMVRGGSSARTRAARAGASTGGAQVGVVARSRAAGASPHTPPPGAAIAFSAARGRLGGGRRS